ncbi:hypothetical protein DH2020_005833 [Rehmannia glutinosa]|uniref:Uncharacterized protein n=1 Tax=Rehmannia glutinosa TaxID=99300 RepID=A0ABR0XH60_REHGL
MDEAEKEYKKLSDKINEGREAMKASYAEFIAEAQTTASRRKFVGLKLDVPTWVPFIVSFIFFGTALLGVSYGIVSASWDPLREGSLLGWNEARKNWPVFWQSIWGGSKKN